MENKRPSSIHYTRQYANLKTPDTRLHASASEWGPAQAQHLLMRAAFGGSAAEIATAAALPRNEVIDLLLDDRPLPAPPGPDDWVNAGYATRGLTPEERQARNRLNAQRFRALRDWWMEQMLGGPYNLREKMVLFWHGHFATEAVAVRVSQLLYRNNDMMRRNALGNFRTFLKEMWRDAAMLVYLNGVQNRVGNPNENFARELLELFTMGVDQYTETDIREAARAFTGWRVRTPELDAYLDANLRDYEYKEFLGQRGNYDGDDIVDIVLQQPVTAQFICRKLYAFFVNFEPEDGEIERLAGIFRDGDYEIKPVLRALFASDSFYSEANVGALIKSPAHLVTSTVRQLGLPAADLNYLNRSSDMLDQSLFSPPNVAGWPGQRTWISPQLLATRSGYCESALVGGRIDRNLDQKNLRPIATDLMAFARSFGINGARELLNAWIEHFMVISLDELTKEALLSILLDSAAEDDWSLDYEGVEGRVAACLLAMLRLPEFQLT